MTAPVSAGFLAEVRAALGARWVVTDTERTATHGRDWTGRFVAAPPVVVRPGSCEEVAAIIAAARTHGVAVVAQGGNTGLVGGATPCDGEVVVDLRRLDAITDVDAEGGQLTAGAGATVAAVQAAATAAGWRYGVDWAARDTATIGGAVATDAGGLRFVRHGGTRRQLLGVEAVLGSGTTIAHLPRVDKDNTGYDLAAVLCGSEGTLGVVTATRLRLVAPAGRLATALVGFASTELAVAAAVELRRALVGLEAVELMVADGVELVRAAGDLPAPFATPAPTLLLVEVDHPSDPEGALTGAVAGLPGVVDAAVAADGPRRAALWRYREDHTTAINRLGPPHKLDVTLPLGELAGFVDAVGAIVAAVEPSARTWCFGHAADGNVHVNVTGLAADDDRVDGAVLDAVIERRGSISAEHGIGRAKRPWLARARSAGDLVAFEALRSAFDPDRICNPAVLVPEPASRAASPS